MAGSKVESYRADALDWIRRSFAVGRELGIGNINPNRNGNRYITGMKMLFLDPFQ